MNYSDYDFLERVISGKWISSKDAMGREFISVDGSVNLYSSDSNYFNFEFECYFSNVSKDFKTSSINSFLRVPDYIGGDLYVVGYKNDHVTRFPSYVGGSIWLYPDYGFPCNIKGIPIGLENEVWLYPPMNYKQYCRNIKFKKLLKDKL